MPMRSRLWTVLAICALAACSEPVTHEPPSDGSLPVLAISNDSKEVDLVLTETTVYMQLSEQMLEKLRAEFDKERAEAEDSKFATGIKNFVLDKVENLISYQIEYGLDEISGMRYEEGWLIVEVEKEKLISFDDIEVDGERKVMQTFEERDAKRFVRRFEALRKGFARI